MNEFRHVIDHIRQGTSYSWDVTVLLGLGLALSTPLRQSLLKGEARDDEAAMVTSLYTRLLLERDRD